MPTTALYTVTIYSTMIDRAVGIRLVGSRVRVLTGFK